MNYTKGNIGASAIWEASGNNEVIGIKDAVTLTTICYIKPPNWDMANLISAAPDMYAALKAQHDAIDTLFAMLISRDKDFFPSKSGQPWDAIIQGNKALAKAEGK